MRRLTPIEKPQAWYRADHEEASDWIYEYKPDTLREIDEGLNAYRRRDPSMTSAATKADFPLQSAAADFVELGRQIEDGRGFVLLRGLPVERYDEREIVAIYRGIGAHFGREISQNAAGDLVTHVRDTGLEYGAQNVRGYMTRGGQKMHTDNSDIVALLCYRKARSGGHSSIACSMTVYNEFLARHPQYLDQLYAGFHYDLRGEERPGMPAITRHRIPVFSYFESRLSCRYVYMSIVQASRKQGQPLSRMEEETLNLFNEIAARDDVRFDMDLIPGDIQLLNNHSVIHGRTAYEDFDEPERKRHMIRLWLVPQHARPLEPSFADRYGTGERLGVPPVAEEAAA